MIVPTAFYDPTTPADILRARKPPPGRPVNAFWRGLDYQRLLKLISLSIHARGWRHDPPAPFLFWRGGGMVAGFNIHLTTWAVPNSIPALGVRAFNVEAKGQRYYCGLALPDSAVVTRRWQAEGGMRKAPGPEALRSYDLLTEAEEAVDRWAEAAGELAGIVATADTTFLNADDAGKLLRQAALRGWLPKGRGVPVDRRFQDANRQTAWCLLVEFGRAVRHNPPPKQMEHLLGFFRIVSEACHLTERQKGE